MYFCLKCKKESKHEHKLIKFKNIPELMEDEKDGEGKD